MNKKKLVIILISLFVFILLLAFILTFNFKREDEAIVHNYLVVNETDIWEFKNNVWYILDNMENNNQIFNVYLDRVPSGNYRINKTSQINLYDLDGELIKYNGDILAYSGDFKIDFKNYTIDKISTTDLNDINNILDTNMNMNNLTTNEKVLIDLDNNGVEDKIINVSNISFVNSDEEVNNYFNLIYIVLNNKIQVLKSENIDAFNLLLAPMYNIDYILNINNKKYDNILFNERYFSYSQNSRNIMYEYDNDAYINIIDYEI